MSCFPVDRGLSLSLLPTVLVLFFLCARAFYVTKTKFGIFLQTTVQTGCHSNLPNIVKDIRWFVIFRSLWHEAQRYVSRLSPYIPIHLGKLFKLLWNSVFLQNRYIPYLIEQGCKYIQTGWFPCRCLYCVQYRTLWTCKFFFTAAQTLP